MLEKERERERERGGGGGGGGGYKADFFPFVQLDRKVCCSDGAWASEL